MALDPLAIWASAGPLGLLVAVTTAGYQTASFMSGYLLRILPIGPALAVSIFAASTGLLGFAVAPTWSLMIVLGFVAGLGGGAVDAGLNSYGARYFSPQTLNWLHAFFGLVTTIGPVIVSLVLGSGRAWWLSYTIVGSAQLAFAMAFLFLRRRWDDVGELSAGDKEAAVPAPALETIKRPIVWLGMLVFFFYSGVEISAAQWSYSLLLLGRGFSEAGRHGR